MHEVELPSVPTKNIRRTNDLPTPLLLYLCLSSVNVQKDCKLQTLITHKLA